MAKKKNRGGGGGGGGGGSGGQPQKPAEPTEEGEEQTVAADNDSASGEATAEDNKDKGKGQDNKEKGKGQDGKDKGKKTPPPPPLVTAVLKVDMHCDGCAKRIRASGVAMEVDKGTMTVVGRFDAKKLRDRVAKKTRKKVDLVANNNAGNKQGGGGGGNNNNKGGGGGGNQHKQGAGEADGKPEKEHDHGGQGDKGTNKDDHQEDKGSKDNKGGGGGDGGAKGKGGGKDNKKPAVVCVEQVKMDMAKNQVTVTGTMDAKALPEKLRKKLRRPVEVVTAKDGKDKDGKQQEGGGGGKDKDGKEKDAATKP
nr:unnamed protein product [Digitaria exilis]